MLRGISFITSHGTCVGAIKMVEAGTGYVTLDKRSDDIMKKFYKDYDTIMVNLKDLSSNNIIWVTVYNNVMENTNKSNWSKCEYQCNLFEVDKSYIDTINNG